MKIIAYTALHYGAEYLEYAARSVIDHIDEWHVLYTPHGSHGHQTDTPCPESRDSLYAIAQRAGGDKLRWHDGDWKHEGEQRDSIYEYAPDADVILVLDADEIWPKGMAAWAIWRAKQYNVKAWRVPIIHYWRSFYRAVIHDPAYPVRVISPKSTVDETFVLDFNDWNKMELCPRYISHMGYAQRPEIVAYKQLTHGHRNEWRTDIDWFNERFMANAQEDCHPVGSEYWNPEPVEPLDYMPGWMALHPYFTMEVIG